MEEANKEQAQRCRDLGLAALRNGEHLKGVRLLEKSFRMYPEPSTKSLIDTAGTQQSPSGNSKPKDPTNAAAESDTTKAAFASSRSNPVHSAHTRAKSQPRATHPQQPPPSDATAGPAASPKESEPSVNSTQTATPEQQQLCRRILSTKDHYEVLGVPRDATDDQIKKAYKKLAFQLHPDKNRAPHAEEAFKKISKVFQCLSDSNKRAIYDQFGNDEDVPQQYRTQYESDFMTPEELFEAFFGVDLGSSRRYHVQRQRRYRRQASNEPQTRFAGLAQMVPVLILLAITIFSSFLNQPPSSRFEFTRSSDYPIGRTSARNRIRYYVSSSMAYQQPYSFERLDIEAEMAYFSPRCRRDQNDNVRKMNLANSLKDADERRKLVESLNMPPESCREYEELRRSLIKIINVADREG